MIKIFLRILRSLICLELIVNSKEKWLIVQIIFNERLLGHYSILCQFTLGGTKRATNV